MKTVKMKNLERLETSKSPAILQSYKGMFSKMFALHYPPVHRDREEREYYFATQKDAHKFYKNVEV